MIAVAVELVGGAREAIAFARKRHAMWKVQLHPGTSHPAVPMWQRHVSSASRPDCRCQMCRGALTSACWLWMAQL